MKLNNEMPPIFLRFIRNVWSSIRYCTIGDQTAEWAAVQIGELTVEDCYSLNLTDDIINENIGD